MASTLLPSTLRTSLLEKVGFSVGFGVGFMRTPQRQQFAGSVSRTTNKARVRAGDDRVGGDEGLGVSHDSVTEISTFVEVGADATHRGERECGEATWLCHSKKVTKR